MDCPNHEISKNHIECTFRVRLYQLVDILHVLPFKTCSALFRTGFPRLCTTAAAVGK